ncbi:hypothetical protein NQ317_011242 [Molorchus minor]|uniref:DUF5641 domain-containing protein n=1 Tax=Molorchus minor TaxID=1323400 RepID=A0ABQ9J8T4_9CUCU|nr:hypothetical protein NQ317_011242 [Molorchus minor]
MLVLLFVETNANFFEEEICYLERQPRWVIYKLHRNPNIVADQQRRNKKETSKDAELQLVIKYVRNERWPKQVSQELKPYFNRRHELEVENGVLIWGHRIIIPRSLKKRLLSELHTSHFGISRTKSLTRSADERNKAVPPSTLISRILFTYRTTEHGVTGKTPFQLMFNDRQPRTRLSQVKECLNEKENTNTFRNKINDSTFSKRLRYQEVQKRYHGGRERNFEVGEDVYVRAYKGTTSKQWIKAKIDKKIGRTTYICRIGEQHTVKRHANQILKGCISDKPPAVRSVGAKVGEPNQTGQNNSNKNVDYFINLPSTSSAQPSVETNEKSVSIIPENDIIINSSRDSDSESAQNSSYESITSNFNSSPANTNPKVAKPLDASVKATIEVRDPVKSVANQTTVEEADRRESGKNRRVHAPKLNDFDFNVATVATSVVRSIYRRGDVGKVSSNPNWVFRFSLLKSDSSGMRCATALLSSPVCYEVRLYRFPILTLDFGKPALELCGGVMNGIKSPAMISVAHARSRPVIPQDPRCRYDSSDEAVVQARTLHCPFCIL